MMEQWVGPFSLPTAD